MKRTNVRRRYTTPLAFILEGYATGKYTTAQGAENWA
jgi:hypothetical protein